MGDIAPAWKSALNEDLKSSPIPSLPPNAATMAEGQICGHYFLQLEETANVLASALKQFSETSRRMLKLRLTDGTQTITVVELEKLNQLSVATPPGTKVVLSGKDIKISCGFWLVEPHHIRVLGGIVKHMLRAWEIHRDVVIHGKRVGREDGRPAWVPFGQPFTFDSSLLKFKAMDIVDRNAEHDDDDDEEEDERAKEFALHRQQILSAAKDTDTNTKIGPLDRRPPKLLQITQPFMSADEQPTVYRRPAAELPRDARDLIDKSDPGVEPTFRARGRGRGRGRGGGRRGRRGRGFHDDDDDDRGSGRPQRSANLMDFVTHQLGNL